MTQQEPPSEEKEAPDTDGSSRESEGPGDREPDKSVDEQWKEQARKEKEKLKEKAKQKQDQDPQQALPEASFSSIVGGIGVQTAMALGQVENPATGETEVDLQQARHLIDSLKVLQEKTEGNLTRQEEQHLTSLLKELQMQFVQEAKKRDDEATTGDGGADAPSGPEATGDESSGIYTP